MKILVVFALCAVLYFELSHGLYIQSLNYRVRRDAEKAADLDDRRAAVYHYAVKEIGKLAREMVNNFKNFLAQLVEEAKKTDMKAEGIAKLQLALSNMNELLASDADDEKSTEKIVHLYYDILRGLNRVGDLEEIDEDVKGVKELLIENDVGRLTDKYIADLMALRSDYEKHIGEYIENLTAEEKVKEKVVIDWFEEFKSATGIENKIGTMMKGFQMLGDTED